MGTRWGTLLTAGAPPGSDNGHYVTSAGRVGIAARFSVDQHHPDEVLVNIFLDQRGIVLYVLKLLGHYV
jgi:hypothetical protein